MGFWGWCMGSKHLSNSHSLLCSFVGSTWRLLITFDIAVITAWMHRDYLSTLVVIPPHYEHARFAPLAGLGLISVYQLCRKGASSSIPGNTSFNNRVLWLMVSFLLFSTTWQHAPSLTWFTMLFAACKGAKLSKITPLLATCNSLVLWVW